MNFSRSAKVKRVVTVFPRYGTLVASSRIRCYHLLSNVEETFDLRFEPLFPNLYIRNKYRKLKINYLLLPFFILRRVVKVLLLPRDSVIWVEKELIPFLPGTAETQIIRTKRIRPVYDFDDNWVDYYSNNSFYLFRRLASKFKFVSDVAFVTTSNEALRVYFESCQIRVDCVLETSIHLIAFAENSKVGNIASRGVTIGWVGTPLTAQLQLSSHVELLIELAQNYTLKLMGVGESLPQVRAIKEVWEESKEIPFIDGCDFGIVPLSDTQFNRGKSFLKAHIFLARGKPVFVSKELKALTEIPGTIPFRSFAEIRDKINYFVENPTEYQAVSIKLVQDYKLLISRDNSVDKTRLILESRFNGRKNST